MGDISLNLFSAWAHLLEARQNSFFSDFMQMGGKDWLMQRVSLLLIIVYRDCGISQILTHVTNVYNVNYRQSLWKEK